MPAWLGREGAVWWLAGGAGGRGAGEGEPGELVPCGTEAGFQA